jgi:SAM-dependent methyltransferase
VTRGHHAPLAYHRALIDDPARLHAWDRAIRAVVRPGDVVLDAGAGTGVLAMLAAKAGARVHAVESTPIAALARELVARNGLTDRVTVHQADLLEIDPIEPVDVVLCDLIGRFVPDGTMHEAAGAAGRWLRRGGRFLPAEVRLFVAPIGDVALPEIDAFRWPLKGLDLSPALGIAEATPYQVWLDPAALLGPAVLFATLTPPDVPAEITATMALPTTRAGVLKGFAGWFSASLTPEIPLDTGPGRPTFWGQVLWPVTERGVTAGEPLPFELTAMSVPDGVAFRWTFDGVTRDSRAPAADASREPALRAADPVATGIALYERGQIRPALHALLAAGDSEPALRYVAACHALLGRSVEATEALERYEQRFGPHPFVRRA